ncbi:MAG TPA: phosphoenolpyruvate carboxylase, partial [Longimicrobiales bacterium]
MQDGPGETRSKWQPTDQQERLAELLSDDVERKEAPLRRDVRSLGELLGDTIREQCGQALFEKVETLRRLAIEHRDAGAEDALRNALQLVRAASVDDAYQLARAFAFYFELTNLAETNHRKRRRRAAQIHHRIQAGEIAGTLQRMRAAGTSAEDARSALARIVITPVFTAHPTEVARRTVLAKRRRIAGELAALDRLPLTEREAETRAARMAAEIAALWQTDEVRRRQPRVHDEIELGLDYYRTVIIETLPDIYDVVNDAFRAVYEEPFAADDGPLLLRFGSWIGGDRDGNPFVTPAVTAQALGLARRTILRRYLAALEALVDPLSTSALQAGVSVELIDAIARYDATLKTPDPSPQGRSEHEPYRHFLAQLWRRVHAALHEPEQSDAYSDASELIADLRIMGQSLAANVGEPIAEQYLRPLLLQVRTFGFHLHTLDI